MMRPELPGAIANPRYVSVDRSSALGADGISTWASTELADILRMDEGRSLDKPCSAHRPFHLKLNELVHLDGVFHRQFLDERLDEPADNQGRCLGLGKAAAHQVEELLLADLGNTGLVADLDVVFVDLDVRIGIGTALRVKDQGVADDIRLRPLAPAATFSRPR